MGSTHYLDTTISIVRYIDNFKNAEKTMQEGKGGIKVIRRSKTQIKSRK